MSDSAAETIDARIIRLKRELSEARVEKRRQELASDLAQADGMVVKSRMKPGPKPDPNRPMIVPSGAVKRTSTEKWRFSAALGRQKIRGPERDTAGEAADDLTAWRQNELSRRGMPVPTDPRTWSAPDADGRQTCLRCNGEGEVTQGRGPCLACAGDGYRWP